MLVAGDLGAAVTWHAAFFLLSAPSLALAVLIHRLLPEPARGGQNCLQPGDQNLRPASVEPNGPAPTPAGPDPAAIPQADPGTVGVRQAARQRADVEVDDNLVLRRDATRLGAWPAARYILRIPTNRLLIISSALGYFFYAGLLTFVVLFAEAHYRLSHYVVTLLVVVVGAGVVAGTAIGGQLTDRLIRRGHLDARLLVAGVTFIAVVLVLLPGLWTTKVVISVPLFVMAGALLGARNPPLDAARLDIVPSRLWGQAEAVRTLTRTLLEASAPLLFGYISSQLGDGPSSGLGDGINTAHQHISAAQGRGLEYTFMIMLLPLAVSGVLLVRSRQRYLRDVATADASERTQPPRPGIPTPPASQPTAGPK